VPTLRNSVDSLTKLHRKAKSIDAYLDDRGDLNTARSAWNEIKDNVERGTIPCFKGCFQIFSLPAETQTRQAFLNTLTIDVVNPLASLKVWLLSTAFSQRTRNVL
jgi:hypothetical protein